MNPKHFPAPHRQLSDALGRFHSDGVLGYHVVWPRDMIQTVTALLAIGAHTDAVRILRYLGATQDADGHWPQNMFLSGKPYWDGIQLDETAFVIFLVDLARREKAIDQDDLTPCGRWCETPRPAISSGTAP